MKVIHLNGNTYNLEELNIKLYKKDISAPSYKRNYERVGNKVLFLGAEFEKQDIELSFFYEAYDVNAYEDYKKQIYAIFKQDEPFYIQFYNEQTDANLMRLCELEPYNVRDLNYTAGEFVLKFKQIQRTQSAPITKKYTGNSFSIQNNGDYAIDPTQTKLKLTLKCTSPGNVEIKNLSNLDSWTYTGPLTINDTVVIDGITAKKQGISIFGNTNRKLIKLVPGVNNLIVNNATNIDLTIEYVEEYNF